MTATLTDDAVLVRFRMALDEIYGSRIERVVLFGSRVRGEAKADSDYDLAVFLKGFQDRWREVGRILMRFARWRNRGACAKRPKFLRLRVLRAFVVNP
jgi:predicted nucleotidyltransferase